MEFEKMKQFLIITPVKDSIQLTELTIRSVMSCNNSESWNYVVYDDFSTEENASKLDDLSLELGFEVVHLKDVIDTPSPNYRYVLQQVQKRAIAEDKHLVIVESDVVAKFKFNVCLITFISPDNFAFISPFEIKSKPIFSVK